MGMSALDCMRPPLRSRGGADGIRRRPSGMCSLLLVELGNVVLGDEVCAGEKPTRRGDDPADEVVVQADRRIMALGKRILSEGPGNHSGLDELHGLIDEVVADDLDLAGLARVLDSLGRPEGASRRHVDRVRGRGSLS